MAQRVCHQAHFGGSTDTLVFLAVLLRGHHPPCLFLSPQTVLAEGAEVWAAGNDSQKIFSYCSNLY